MSSPLLAGTSLIFRIQSQVSFKDKTTYRNVSIAGDIFVWNQLQVLIKVRWIYTNEGLVADYDPYLQQEDKPPT